jgi:poly(3-hydroxybutyrate) depolymerase
VVTSALGAPPDGEIVTFEVGATELGAAALSGGSATFTTSTLKAGGTNTIKAEYAGDSNFAASTSNKVSQVVTQATTTTTLASSQNPSGVGQSVTFTANVAPEFGGTVTGTVTFNSGGAKLGNRSLSGGVASYTTTKLAAGADSITAVYNGNSSFVTSTSGALSQTVNSATLIDATMTWDGVTRYYEVYLPAVLPANPAMVLMLHGTRSGLLSNVITEDDWIWKPVANEYGFILVKPVSTYNPTYNQWNWNAYFMDAAFAPGEGGTCTEPPATGCPDDAGFLRQLIVNLTAQYNVNPNQIYVVGFSSGAQMAERVGVEISDLVAAISPVSGELVGQKVPPPGLPGAALAPISVLEWQGTLDTILPPCNYGTGNYSGVNFTLDTVDDTFNYWVQQNSCTALQTTQPLCAENAPNNANDAPTPNMNGMTGNIATSCAAGNIEVQFIWEPGVTHSKSMSPSVAEAIWLFFAANPKQPAGSTRSR